jgi:hypothetical protein
VVGGGLVYALCNGKLYKYTNPTTVSAVTLPAPLSHIIRWQGWFVGIDANTPWRIWFSTIDASGSHFDIWSANNFYDVGSTDPITALAPMMNTLYVGKRNGWNVVSGVLGTLVSIRAVSLGLGPVDPKTTAVTTDFRIIYWPIEPRPAWFNGMRSWTDTELDVGTRSSPFPCDTVVVTPTARRLLLANDTPQGTGLLTWAGNSWSRHPWQDRAWTRHNFPAKLAGLVPNNAADGVAMPPDVIYAVLAPTTVGDAVVIGSHHHGLDRPAHVNDQYASPVDMGTTNLIAGSVSFPSYFEPIGRQIQVRSVIVQFRKWASGVANARNQIQLRVDSLGAYGRGVTSGDILYWDEPCERSTTDGVDDSWRVNVGQQGFGNGFQINFPLLSGVAIREVVVLVTVRTDRT